MDDVSINGKKILENVPVMFDTGSAFIFGDWNRVSEFYKALGGTLKERGQIGYYYCEFGIAFSTLFLSTASSTLRLFPDSDLYLWWNTVSNRSKSSQYWTNCKRFP
jgi:hypothetical protein